MQNAQSPLEVLDLWHHVGKGLHLGENIHQRLGVIQSCQDLLGKSFLDIVHSFLLGALRLSSWILLSLELSNSALKGIDKILVMGLNLSLLLYSRATKA